MSTDQDYIRDIAEIRSMMERSSKFLSLSGWAGVMAGVYALVGAYIVHTFYRFRPVDISGVVGAEPINIFGVTAVALGVLVLSVATAIVLSYQRAAKRKESLWNATSRRLLISSLVPLMAGGIIALLFIIKGLIGLLAPVTLIFYGLALFTASSYTFKEVKVLGLIQLGLGILGVAFVEYGVLLWALGFGLMHIIYGIYIHIKHER